MNTTTIQKATKIIDDTIAALAIKGPVYELYACDGRYIDVSHDPQQIYQAIKDHTDAERVRMTTHYPQDILRRQTIPARYF